MPRSTFKPDLPTERARLELREYVQGARGRQIELEKATNVKQYTISRFLTGRTRKLSPEIRVVCNYAGIRIDTGIDPAGDNARVQAALAQLWNGEADSAELVAVLIESLGPVVRAIQQYGAKRKSGD
jgi:transcriptional regulator with XRE-family HTH domain